MKSLVKAYTLLSLAFAGLLLSLSVQAAALEAELSKVTLFVEGMMKSRGGVTWMSWPDSVVAALSELPGIQEENITVNLDRDAFTVSYDAALVTLDIMYEAIRELGYSPGLQAPDVSDSSSADVTVSSPLVAALATASQSGKLVLIDFSAEWCAACKVLEAQVFSDATVIEALQDYVFVEVDTDAFPESAKAHDVVGMPTLLVLNSDGEELYRNVGLITPEEFSETLYNLLKDHN